MASDIGKTSCLKMLWLRADLTSLWSPNWLDKPTVAMLEGSRRSIEQ
jgi:hypothetical protein